MVALLFLKNGEMNLPNIGNVIRKKKGIQVGW